MLTTTRTLYGLALVPLSLVMNPMSFLNLTPKSYFLGLCFIPCYWRTWDISPRPIGCFIFLTFYYHVIYIYLYVLPNEASKSIIDCYVSLILFLPNNITFQKQRSWLAIKTVFSWFLNLKGIWWYPEKVSTKFSSMLLAVQQISLLIFGRRQLSLGLALFRLLKSANILQIPFALSQASRQKSTRDIGIPM